MADAGSNVAPEAVAVTNAGGGESSNEVNDDSAAYLFAEARVVNETTDDSQNAPRDEIVDTNQRCGSGSGARFYFLPILCILVIAGVVLGVVFGSDCCNNASPSNTQVASTTRSPDDSTTTTPQDAGQDVTTRQPLLEEDTMALITLVNEITLSNKTLSYPTEDTTASPEELALAWLIESDPFLSSPLDIEAKKFRIGQRYALAVLYFNMNGETWTNSTKWKTSDYECEWFGVSCLTRYAGPEHGLQTTVSILELPDNGLEGSLSNDFALLRFLREFYIYQNAVSGTLPETIGPNMRDLEIFSFWSNSVSGPIPTNFGYLTRLRKFFMGKNRMTGTIPTTIGLMTSLVAFNNDNNLLSGSLPTEMGLLTDMDNFYAVSNQFCCQIPNELSNWQKVRNVFLQDNDFTGTMPEGLCTAPGLQALEADCGEVECSSCCTECQ